jgi:hypothetical protein
MQKIKNSPAYTWQFNLNNEKIWRATDSDVKSSFIKWLANNSEVLNTEDCAEPVEAWIVSIGIEFDNVTTCKEIDLTAFLFPIVLCVQAREFQN